MNKIKEGGFSFLSVLVAFGIAGGVSYVILQSGDNITDIKNRANIALDSKELMTEFRLILEDEKNCKLSIAGEDIISVPVRFKKTDIDEIDKEDGLPIDVWLGDVSGAKREIKKFYEGAIYRTLTLDSVRLFMNKTSGDYPDGDHKDTGTLRVKYSFSQELIKKRYFKDIPLEVSLSTTGKQSTIQTCRTVNTIQFNQSGGGSGSSGTFHTFKKGSCNWTGDVNDWDQRIDFKCPGDKALAGEKSVHDNNKEDRKFRFQCCDVETEDRSVAKRGACIDSGVVNYYDKNVNYFCPQGWIAIGQSSIHNNKHEDRIYNYTCCEYKLDEEKISTVRWNTAYISPKDLNMMEKPVDATCSDESFISGFYSTHSNYSEDRIYSFNCTTTQYQKKSP